YDGKLELWIDSISMAKYIGLTDDLLELLANTSLQDPFSFYTSSGDDISPYNIPNPFITSNSTILSMNRLNPTSYTVILQLDGPTLLVLNQAFSEDWTTRIGGELVMYHLLIHYVANGRRRTGNWRQTVSLESALQTFVW